MYFLEKNVERNSNFMTQEERFETVGSTLSMYPKITKTNTQKSLSRSPRNELSIHENEGSVSNLRYSDIRKSKNSTSQKSQKSPADYQHVRSQDKNFISLTLKDLKNPQVVFLQQSQNSQAIVDVISKNSAMKTQLSQIEKQLDKPKQILASMTMQSF